MSEIPAQPAATPAGSDAAYAAALDLANTAPTPQARAAAVDQLEKLAIERSGGAEAAQPPDGSAEGFEPPASALHYALEQQVPPGVEIADTEALGALKGHLHAAGVPTHLADSAFGDIARLAGAGALASDEAYGGAVRGCRAQLERAHGEGAKALIADALAWIDQTVRANPALEEAAAAALASPQAMQAAANMKRFGRR